MFRRSTSKASLHDSSSNASTKRRWSREPPKRQPSTIDITEGIREMILDNENATLHITTPTEPTFPSKNKSIARGSLHIPMPSDHGTVRATTPMLPPADVEHSVDEGATTAESLDKPIHSRKEDPPSVTRPRLKQPVTAPAAVTDLFLVIPEPPRRANSARITRPLLSPNAERSSPGHSSLSRASSLPCTPTYQTLINRSKVNRKSSCKLGLQPKGRVWNLTSSPVLNRYESISRAFSDLQQNSFTEQFQVQEAPEQKRMRFLNTDIVDSKDRDLPDSPSSLMITPRELYRLPPKGLDLLLKKGKVETPETSPKTERSLSLPLTPTLTRTGTAIRRRSLLSPDEAPWVANVYVPGPIRLAAAVPGMRKCSVASLEPFVGELQQWGDSRRLSDNVVVDEIVAYFLDLEVMDFAGEECADRFWESTASGDKAASGTEGLGTPDRRMSGVPVPIQSPGLAVPSTKYRAAPVTNLQPLRQHDSSPMPPMQQYKQRIGLRRLLQSASSII